MGFRDTTSDLDHGEHDEEGDTFASRARRGSILNAVLLVVDWFPGTV